MTFIPSGKGEGAFFQDREGGERIEFKGIDAEFDRKEVDAKRNTAIEQYSSSALGIAVTEVDTALGEALGKMTQEAEDKEPHKWEAIQKAREHVREAKERTANARDTASQLIEARRLLVKCGLQLGSVIEILGRAQTIAAQTGNGQKSVGDSAVTTLNNVSESVINAQVSNIDGRISEARQTASTEGINYKDQLAKYRQAWEKEAEKSHDWKRAKSNKIAIEDVQTLTERESGVILELHACGLVACEKITNAANLKRVDDVLKHISILQQIEARKNKVTIKLASALDGNKWSKDDEKPRKYSLAVGNEISGKAKEGEKSGKEMISEFDQSYKEGFPVAAVAESSKFLADIIGRKKN